MRHQVPEVTATSMALHGKSATGNLHESRPTAPNVRAKRETTVWRLAREAHDEARRFAGQAPRRWLSA